MSDTLWVLKYCELFGRLSPEKLTHLESRSHLRSFPANSPISMPKGQAESVFVVIQGRLKVCHPPATIPELKLVFVEPGELFGDTAILNVDDRDDHFETVAPSTVVMIPVQEMRHLIAAQEDVAVSITKWVGLRLHRIERRLGSLLFLSYRERLVQLLLDLSDQFGWQGDDGIRLRIKLSHQDLAHLIGSTRETIAVILGQMEAEGSVNGGCRNVVLENPQSLVRV